MTPQVRTRNNLTERGYLVGTVEGKKRFPAKGKLACRACGHTPMIEISVDLWNVFDVIAIHPEDAKVVLVQTTTRPNHSARRNKILSSMEAKLVLLAGVNILVQSWRQKAEGERWQLFEEWITLDQFKQAPHYPSNVRDLVEIRRKEKAPDLPPGSAFRFTPIADVDLPF
jgi:hypothetical protein